MAGIPIPVKAVLSDAGGILFDDSYGGTVIYPAAAKALGMEVRQLNVEFNRYKVRAQTKPHYTTKDAWKDFYHAKGMPEAAVHELFRMYDKSWASLKPYDGVRETLAALGRRGIDFIVLTDAAVSAREMEVRWRSSFGLDRGLTGVISSKDLGVTKPAKKFFDTALRTYGLKKDEVVFVAHDLDELEGAHKLGFRVLALNYDRRDDLGFIPEERKLRSFPDLLAAVEPMVPSSTESNCNWLRPPKRRGRDPR